MDAKTYPVTHTDAEWRARLTPEQYQVMRNHGTERPGSCALLHEKRAGTFNTAIPINAWSHLTMVVNNGELQLYLNGELVNTMTGFPDVFTPAAATQFAIGVNYWDAPYQGYVDQLQIFDEAIDGESAQSLFMEASP